MKVFILTSTGHSDGNTQIEGVFFSHEDARKKMEELFNSSKKFWENYEKEWNCKLTDRFSEVSIELGDYYANAYCTDEDYEEIGMSWNIDSANVEGTLPTDNLKKTEEVLADNGIDTDETESVLQAIGYTLLDTELYPNE
jgi:hypothetical protein